MAGARFFTKLARKDILMRVVNERLSESLAVNLLSLASLCMGFRARVLFDTVIRQHNAYGLLRAADAAKELGYERVTAVEFGVAAGAGLMNMAEIGAEVTRITGVGIDLYGLDSGKGLPGAVDYRDHPEAFARGDYPMDLADLQARLPGNCRLLIGDIAQTVDEVRLSADSPLGYVVLDVDYYSSAVPCLKIFEREAKHYLPSVHVYADDTSGESMNPWCGELLAIGEFNAGHAHRKISHNKSLAYYRPCKHGRWLERMYVAHILDSRFRSPQQARAYRRVEINPYFP